MATQLPLTYPDLVCGDDLDGFATETTSDFQNLVQDVGHILVELPGSNPDDPTRGVGIEMYLSGTEDKFRELPSVIENQLERDDRINTVSASATKQTDGTFLIQIQISVSASVLSLEFTWADVAGLQLVSAV